MKVLLKKTRNILKIKIVKKGLALLLLFGIASVFFQANIVTPQTVYAATPATTATPAAQTEAKWAIDTQSSENKMISKTETLNAILKIIYIILWPLLSLAGLTLDNGMIYGSFFALDAPLWKFWNIMKNFANFALWFLVLFEIIKSIFAWFKNETAVWWPMKIIKKALIAGILIQASWFLLAAVIDVSTVATYAIWWLPLSVLEKNDDLWNKPVLWNHSKFNLKDYDDVNKAADNFDIWYSYWQAKHISKCDIREWRYIIWLMDGTPDFRNKQYTNNHLELCTYGNILYAFSEYDDPSITNAKTAVEYSTALTSLWNTNRTGFLWTVVVDNSCPDKIVEVEWFIPHAIDLANCTSRVLAKQKADAWLATQRDDHDGMTISKMLTKSAWFTGPLVTMYTSLLNFAEISNVPKQWENIWAMWIEMLIKTIFALALIVPLALLGVVLLARIGVLRMVIAFMPFLVLIWVFWRDEKLKEGQARKLMDLVGKPGRLAWIIFAPVIIVFALSISVIFMTALSNMLNDNAKQHDFFDSVWMMYDDKTGGIKVTNAVDIYMKWNETGSDFDNIKSFTSWLFMNLFGIALVWMILFAAIKATSLWKNINDAMGGADKLLWKALWAIPIMSVKWGDGQRHGVGLTALWNVAPSALNDKLNRMTNAETTALRNAINPVKSSVWGPDATVVQEYNALVRSWLSTSKAAKAVWFSEKQITESAAYWTSQTNITKFNQEFDSSGFTSWQEVINPADTINMSKESVIYAMNTGKLKLSADAWVQAGDKHYIVTQTASWMGWYTYWLEEIKDSKNITKADKAMAEKKEIEILKKQAKLAKDNADTHKTLLAMDSKNAEIWREWMARLNTQSTTNTNTNNNTNTGTWKQPTT